MKSFGTNSWVPNIHEVRMEARKEILLLRFLQTLIRLRSTRILPHFYRLS